MKIVKSIYHNWLDQQNYKPKNKAHKELIKRNKVGKFRYHITDNEGFNHISMIRLMSQNILDDTRKMRYEIFGYHGQETKTFDTYNQAIKWIQDLYDGKIKLQHNCECGLSWESN